MDREATPDRTLVELVRANLPRALVVSAVVGTILILINHGDHLADEPVCDRFFTKTGLTYVVPFLVSMVSGVLASRDRRG